MKKKEAPDILRPMKLRRIILILAMFTFLSALTGGILYYYSFRRNAFQKTKADAYAKLNLLADQLSFHLTEHIKPARTLSGIKELETALTRPDLETIYQANLILDNFTRSLDVEVSYLLNIDGLTICSSNRNEKDSFVGKNFSFRPYYKKAIAGEPTTYLALGTTSLKRGVYHSHPVYGSVDKNIIGVAVIKASVEFVENKLFPESDDILLFVNPDGIIFISNQSDLKFKILWQPIDKTMDQIAASRQFGNGPWPWAGFSAISGRYVTDQLASQYLFTSLDVAHYPGWKIINLRNYEQLEKQVSEPFVRIIGPVITSILILTGILVFVLYRLGIQEIIKRKKAEKELRLSEERYRRIYHKTPVMLHSIDTDGFIISVSDHWLEVMGYNREAVIGKQLISFFTPESKKYAVRVIFPRFFSTGFCKDVPYTYVRKNGEKIDILLSCYGVRDDSGQVIRSLAVSVDVTEKNQTQQDLQIAKEKLSRYSLNLEQQVEKRTRQLENAQENLKNLSKNIIASQEREKAIVARELHDHLGQVLTALRIDAIWAEKYLSGMDITAGKRAGKMSTLIDDTIKDVRDMAYRLRPRVLDDLGITDALESLVSDFEKRSNVACVFNHDTIPEIDDTLATALYRIGQEAVTNALRHSNAATISVTLLTDKDGIVLTIRDDGDGFNLCDSSKEGDFGLEGMKERANLVGGKLEIFSEINKGTTICCKVSVKR